MIQVRNAEFGVRSDAASLVSGLQSLISSFIRDFRITRLMLH